MSSEHTLHLRALQAHEAPRSAALSRDAQGLISGPQGLVLLQGRSRLHAFLAAFSHVAALDTGVQLEAHPADQFIVTLHPPADGFAPTRYYPAAQAALQAARLSPARAQLYVGDGHCFVPYAHPAAPHGYDALGPPPAAQRVLLQPDRPPLFLPVRPADLLEALLQVPLYATTERKGTQSNSVAFAPLPQRGSGAARLVSLSNQSLSKGVGGEGQFGYSPLGLLTDRRATALIAGYLQRHGLRYALRFLTWHQAQTSRDLALFDIIAHDDQRPVPRFVCDFMQRLPHTLLLADALEPASLEHEPARRVLLPLGQETPLYLPHVQELLPPRCILIQTGATWGYALLTAPTPRTRMQQICQAQINFAASATMSSKPSPTLRIPLALYPTAAGPSPVHALLLDEAAIVRIQRMVRRLPAPLLAQIRIALGEKLALLLANDHTVISGIPLGQALVRSNPANLLLPRGMRLLPALPPDLLVSALGLQAHQVTILTPTRRYEVDNEALQPLSSLLSFIAPQPTQAIQVRVVPMPALDLSGLELRPQQPPVMVSPPEAPAQAKRGLLARLRPLLPSEAPFNGDFASELRRRARALEEAGDYELAAAFYSYLQDDQRAAVCYQRIIAQTGREQ
ncbi:hypothetical protein [Candidatus Viridilinea mediisalina]|uniref:Uncharacterized protein n=1 Tax=Candidatus Viridilinea mediisalina TaxID=2024553 RepID=A0A2A6RF28_9CHLR|nr:hypothetical protein [Candidatus Viridilinea mediisalina]PDW01543.1 hypothetical protein CJ255_18565 [Candidatus Viridilinea mediisalina]